MNAAKTNRVITVIGERDDKGRYWILRQTENGRMDVVGRKYRSRTAAVAAAKKIGGKVQFWH
jgi:hypothetical protein